MFRHLYNFVSIKLNRETTVMRTPISVERRVAITLWRLATNMDYRSIGYLFGVARCTACKIVNEVCTVIAQQLLEQYISVPTGNSLTAVVTSFEDTWDFPQCAGAIDGSHNPHIGTVLWISILVGLDLGMMHAFWPTLNCTNVVKWDFCFQNNLNGSKVFQFLS